jgi:hypothetical protein
MRLLKMRLEEMWIIETAFESKRRKGKAAGKNTHRRHTERLVTEIEMLKVVLHLVSRSHGQYSSLSRDHSKLPTILLLLLSPHQKPELVVDLSGAYSIYHNIMSQCYLPSSS